MLQIPAACCTVCYMQNCVVHSAVAGCHRFCRYFCWLLVAAGCCCCCCLLLLLPAAAAACCCCMMNAPAECCWLHTAACCCVLLHHDAAAYCCSCSCCCMLLLHTAAACCCAAAAACCMLVHAACWCMLVHAGACWCMLHAAACCCMLHAACCCCLLHAWLRMLLHADTYSMVHAVWGATCMLRTVRSAFCCCRLPSRLQVLLLAAANNTAISIQPLYPSHNAAIPTLSHGQKHAPQYRPCPIDRCCSFHPFIRGTGQGSPPSPPVQGQGPTGLQRGRRVPSPPPDRPDPASWCRLPWRAASPRVEAATGATGTRSRAAHVPP
jgi:hypothetical protein